MTAKSLRIVFVFDLDNTLAECSESYVISRSAFTRWVAESIGKPLEEEARERFIQIDEARYVHLKTSPERWPGSMIITAREMHAEHGLEVSEEKEREINEIGKSVFSFEYTPYPGALELLGAIRQSGVKIAICTKGDQEVQMTKIRRWKYEDHVDAVHVCGSKTKEEILAAASKAAPGGWDRLVVVGDTRRDDVAAGQAAGATTVWIKNPHLNKGWRYDLEHGEVKADITVDTIAEVREAISHLLEAATTTVTRARPSARKL